MVSTLRSSCPFILTTCHSTAAIAIDNGRATEAKTNARTDQRFTRRGIPALWYQKPRLSQGLKGIPALIGIRPANPKASFLIDEKWQLTYGFFALNTGNVLSRSTFLRQFNRIACRVNSGPAGNGRCAAKQKVSQMLRLARDQREGGILSRRLNSCVEQERLSPSQAL